MTVVVDREQELLAGVRAIAADVAAVHADDVDRAARFPAETIDALRAAGALSAPVPEALGGGGVSVGAIAECCHELGRSCGASAMVFAMHQIQLLDDRPPPGARQLVRGLPAPAGGRGTAHRLGDLGDRDRRRHGPLDRGGHPRRRRAAELREAGAHRQLRDLCRRPAHDAAPRRRGRARRPGGRPHPRRPALAGADRDLGRAGHARHVLSRIGGACPLRRRAGARDPVCPGRGRVDGAPLAHPVVAPVAGDRRGRLRAGAGVRQGRRQADPRGHAARGAAPVATVGRAGAAPGPGRPRA